MSVLEAHGLTYHAQGKPLVTDASFRLEPGELTMLIGPNGSGKSTLLRLALGLLAPDVGEALIDGTNVRTLSPVARARKAAHLPQTRPLAWPMPVRDVIALGRFAYGAAPGRLAAEDSAAVARAIAACRLAGFEDRAADTLSGGELARVHLARALATEAPLLIADEPVAALDPRYQHEVAQLFAHAAHEGRGVLTVVHDLPLAARYADRLIWMKDGRIVANGTVEETMTAARLADVFGIAAKIERSESTLTLSVIGPA
ncbi:ABC transporter ATP-binding protein [Pelagerythrobacter marensis]|uniref:Iron compound ABC transporter, ATP-binding protein n=1 Tax=Pelagerythrobacter marensis TaxID=543877 RepID=A0A0G3X4S2_9SPHN|nr:ABC transporter ATP-binding protein [Pelagerythrobacter marensis]AKM06172.1 Iron compound ABC transporter, ATP-binding protein [Pelagerythrobacter marensis]